MASNDSTTKSCSKCGESKPATFEFFTHCKEAKDGFSYRCKSCDHAYYLKDKDSKLAKQKIEREKDPEKFRARDKASYYKDIERTRALERIRYYKNKDRVREQQKARRVKSKTRTAIRSRAWALANPDKIKQSSANGTSRRRARKHNLPASFSNADWARCLSYWGNCCCICNRPDGLWHKIVREHWVAITDTRPDNPGTVPWNILPMCHCTKGSFALGSCNQSKGNSDPVEWLTHQLGKQSAQKKLDEIEAYFDSVRPK